MATKRFSFSHQDRIFQIHAEQEGVARFMVRMGEGDSSSLLRIGYMCGSGRYWSCEFYGKSAPRSLATSSAKEACHALALDAITRGMFSERLS